MLTALSAAFRDMHTGGVSADNFRTIWPLLTACGGAPASEIAAGNFDAITDLAATANPLQINPPNGFVRQNIYRHWHAIGLVCDADIPARWHI